MCQAAVKDVSVQYVNDGQCLKRYWSYSIQTFRIRYFTSYRKLKRNRSRVTNAVGVDVTNLRQKIDSLSVEHVLMFIVHLITSFSINTSASNDRSSLTTRPPLMTICDVIARRYVTHLTEAIRCHYQLDVYTVHHMPKM